jgi:hypothetical protein
MPCRKFLDPYRISNLIAYLEKLHAKGLAGSVSLLCGAGPNCVPSVFMRVVNGMRQWRLQSMRL